MVKKSVSAALCAAFLLSTVPAMAASNEMPQGKRDEMSMKDTKHQYSAHQKENKQADKNVDKLIDNRK